MKIIIDNRSELPDYDALAFVAIVIRNGRMSGKDDCQYAYLTTFRNDSIQVAADKNKNSDRFIITGGVNENHQTIS